VHATGRIARRSNLDLHGTGGCPNERWRDTALPAATEDVPVYEQGRKLADFRLVVRVTLTARGQNDRFPATKHSDESEGSGVLALPSPEAVCDAGEGNDVAPQPLVVHLDQGIPEEEKVTR
jgi:hypothetical protein